MVATGNMPALARMPQLDGLRGLAALAVFAFHGWLLSAWTVSGADGALVYGATRVLSLGWSGVDVFFTLSAFLLSLPFAGAARDRLSPPLLGAYFARRAGRILPAYWVQLLLIGALLAIPAQPDEWLRQALMLYHTGEPPLAPWVPVWWTLPVELGFYLVLPALALLFRPRRWPWLLLLVAAAWAWRFHLLATDLTPALRYALVDHLPGRIDQFAIGMLGAYAWVRFDGRLRSRMHGEWMAALGIVAVVGLHLWPFWLGSRAGPAPSTQPWLTGWHGLMSLALLPLLWAAADGRSRLLGWLGRPAMRGLGAVSFSLYLWHYPLMLAARPWLDLLPAGPVRPFLFLLAMLGPCLAVAWLSWRLVERPGMRWTGGRRQAEATQAAVGPAD